MDFSFKTVFFFIILSFVSFKEVDAALLYVTKAKPGPTFFRELGDKGNKALLILKNTSCFLSHRRVYIECSFKDCFMDLTSSPSSQQLHLWQGSVTHEGAKRQGWELKAF